MDRHSIQRILVPTDMSEFATLALDYALLIRKKAGAQITLLYAEEFAFLLTAEYPLGFHFEDSTSIRKHAEELLRNYSRRMVPEMAGIRTLVVDDSPARAIVRTADDIDADLVIMGTHGRHGLRGTLLGSVTERVLRDTSRPVMTVIPHLSPPQPKARIQKILCPVNFTEVARQALEHAASFAEMFGAELILVNVVEAYDPRDVERRFSEWLDPWLRERTRYQQLFVSGDPAARVLELSDEIGADLLVVGAQHTRFSDATVIGTTTERITRFAKRPVLTVMRRVEGAKREELVGVLAGAATA